MNHRTKSSTPRALERAGRILSLGTLLGLCLGSAGAHANVSGLLATLEGMEDGTWQRLNINTFPSVWPDLVDRTFPVSSANNPSAVLGAWSGFAWDSKRGDLILWGGGHANYAGNEVYRWRARNLSWERASLPSKIVDETFAGSNAVPVVTDSSEISERVYDYTAPSSAHVYGNNIYLPNADRFLTFGGAAAHSGGRFTLRDESGVVHPTGPYFWDPEKADGSKVGGIPGSAIRPEVVAGNMWENRRQSVFSSLSVVNGGGAWTEEGGIDVVYFIARTAGGTNGELYRYAVPDVNDPSLDTVSKVGRYFGGPSALGPGAYDPDSKLFVALGGGETPFVAWDLDTPGPGNNSVPIAPVKAGSFDFTVGFFGIDFDPNLDLFVIWGGDGSVWGLDAPDAGTTAGVWTLSLLTNGALLGAGEAPNSGVGTGIWGKWQYAPDLAAFIALEANAGGDVWVYRPQGWVNPVPEPSSVVLMVAGLLTLARIARTRKANA